MSINFQTFLEKTGYTAPYAARSILYSPNSRPALLAGVLELDVEGEYTKMTNIVAGKGEDVVTLETSSKSKHVKAPSPQIDLIETVQSKPVDNAA